MMNSSYKTGLLAIALCCSMAYTEVSHFAKAKKLMNPTIRTLEAIFTANQEFAAGIIIKLDIACSAAKKVEHDFATMPESKTQERLTGVLRSVLEYLSDLKDQRGLIEPLVQESFGASRYQGSILREMLGASQQIDTFFHMRIKNKADLLKICQELNDFFQDFKASLTGPYLELAEQKKVELRKLAALARAKAQSK